MRHTDGYFKTEKGARIYHQCWLPEDPPKARLLLVHGLAEHSGRYKNLVDRFVPQGYAVYGMDHVGHGNSGGTRVYVDRFQDYLDPLDTVLSAIRGQAPQTPIFLVGHSMGGLIVTAYLLGHQEKLTGAILSGPSVQVPKDVSFALVLCGRIFSALLPKLGLVPLDAEGISRDPAVVAAYVNDPLVVTGKITARLGAELLKTMAHVMAEAHRINLPVLILQGGGDLLVDPAGARALHDRLGSADKTLTVYPGLYHELFNEPEHGQVLDNVQRWLETHVTGPAGTSASPVGPP